MSELLKLAERCEQTQARLDRIVDNEQHMTVAGQQAAIALLMSLNLDLFGKCAEALRARSAQP